MSSKSTKKKSKWKQFVPKKLEFSERNQKLIDEINSDPKSTGYMDMLMGVFSKWRLITYAAIIFLPPYGLYRVWSKDSTFRMSEKVTWSIMIVAYMLYFVKSFI